MPIVSCSLDGKPGYKWGESGKCYTYDEGDAEGMKDALRMAASQAAAAYASGYDENVKLPSYVISALRKGLELHKDGKSGQGLKPATVRAATDAIKNGYWSDDKIIRASAWLARHTSDRDLTGGRDWSDPPTPGFVAWLLWGDSGDGKGKAWLDKKADEIRSKKEEAPKSKDDKDQGTPAPPEDRIKGGRNTGKAAGGSRGKISLNDRIVQALKRYVKTHNELVGDDARKRANLVALKKVWLRGAGAFSTSHRPGMTRAQWAFGRVRAFLKMLKNLKPDDPKYNGPDNDLLPKEHPLSSKKEEVNMDTNEGYKYEGYGRLYEGDYGKKFSELKYDMGKMLYYFGQKDLGSDDKATEYAEMLSALIASLAEKPEHGMAARSSFYHSMGELADFISAMISGLGGETASPLVGEMIQFAMMILKKCEDRDYKKEYHNDEREEGEPEEMTQYEEHNQKCHDLCMQIDDYMESGTFDAYKRARLERQADSYILIAERMHMDSESYDGYMLLINKLETIRA